MILTSSYFSSNNSGIHRIIITPEAFSSLYIFVFFICDRRHSIERVVEFRSFVEHSSSIFKILPARKKGTDEERKS